MNGLIIKIVYVIYFKIILLFNINMNSLDKESYINILETKNTELLQELQIYDCCSTSLMKELDYLKNLLYKNNIVY